MNIGGYQTVRLLGKGGMSEVYEVENARLGSRHALKVFAYGKDDPEVRDRFLVEGRLLARLSHPRIVRVSDFGTDAVSGKPYFVMDLVQNERGEMQLLSDVEPGTVDEATIGMWYDDLREGLRYIHANGVIHRDLKLQNVLIGPDGHAVLTDFGISKIFDVKGDGVQIVDTVKTLVKVKEGRSLVMGSLGYMAPELEMGVAASPQSDYYALGVIVYRLLTGTWCDSRTDLVGALETYDPVWMRIVPRLLHANPNGRECLSYSEEVRKDREKAELEAEDRWLREKERGHRIRHAFRYGVAGMLMLVFGFSLAVWKYERTVRDGKAQIAELKQAAAVPTFENTFSIPAGAEQESTQGKLTRAQYQSAMIDALVLTQGIFADLRDGAITVAKAKSELVRLWSRARHNDFNLFYEIPETYSPSGENAALEVLLRDAVRRLK